MSGPAGSRAFSRRGLLRLAAWLAGGAGAALVAGCDLDPRSSTPAAPAPSPDPDVGVVRAARGELRGLLHHLQVTPGAASLVAVHRQQLLALQGTPPPRGERGHPWTKAQVEAGERRAMARFRHWALIARDGDLARVLASVAAGIGMQPELREAA